MAFAVSITKEIDWQGGLEQFSNVYQYMGADPDELQANAILDYLIPVERAIFALGVRFVEARVFETSGTPAENNTVLIRDLTGTGEASTLSTFYRECCLLIKWRSTRENSLGRPVYFRKHLHTASVAGASVSAGQQNGSEALPTATLLALADYGEAVRSFTAGGVEYVMGTNSGDLTASAGIPDPYIQHRQFGS